MSYILHQYKCIACVYMLVRLNFYLLFLAGIHVLLLHSFNQDRHHPRGPWGPNNKPPAIVSGVRHKHAWLLRPAGLLCPPLNKGGDDPLGAQSTCNNRACSRIDHASLSYSRRESSQSVPWIVPEQSARDAPFLSMLDVRRLRLSSSALPR